MNRIPNIFYRVSSADRPALRIGLLLDSREKLSAFAATIVEDIKASNFANIELVIVNKNSETASPSPAEEENVEKKSRHRSHSNSSKRALYELYLRLDAKMKPADDPLAEVDGSALLSGIETLEFDSSEERPAQVQLADALKRIRSAKLDVLIQLGCNPCQDDVWKGVRCGMWFYHFGDEEFYRGKPSHFWELRENAPLSGVTLQAVGEELSSALVLAKAWFATERTLSVSRNRYAPYWGSSELVISRLNALHQFGWDYLRAQGSPVSAYRGKQASYETPTNRNMLGWLGPILTKKAISYPFRRNNVQHWRIAIRMNATPLYQTNGEADVSGFRWIESPRGSAWADPFLFEHEGKCWAFFEDYSYQTGKAGLACAEVSDRGEFGTVLPCLSNAAHHYSYPHVFRDGNEIFMIPESFDSNTVDIYRCRKFPDQWVYEALLLQGKFVDTTVWKHDGLWWFATTSADPGPGAGSLLLFYSESVTGDWTFHPSNPISTDIRTNRGAGRIIRTGNRLIRPNQSCAPSYGYSVSFSEITELSKERYSERLLKTISPKAFEDIAGIHTYNTAGKFEVIDGRCPVALKNAQLPRK